SAARARLEPTPRLAARGLAAGGSRCRCRARARAIRCGVPADSLGQARRRPRRARRPRAPVPGLVCAVHRVVWRGAGRPVRGGRGGSRSPVCSLRRAPRAHAWPAAPARDLDARALALPGRAAAARYRRSEHGRLAGGAGAAGGPRGDREARWRRSPRALRAARSEGAAAADRPSRARRSALRPREIRLRAPDRALVPPDAARRGGGDARQSRALRGGRPRARRGRAALERVPGGGTGHLLVASVGLVRSARLVPCAAGRPLRGAAGRPWRGGRDPEIIYTGTGSIATPHGPTTACDP